MAKRSTWANLAKLPQVLWQLGVVVSVLLAAHGFFTNYGPPDLPFGRYLCIVVAVLALGCGILIRCAPGDSIRRSLSFGALAVMLLVSYAVLLRFLTVVTPEPREPIRFQIGFYKADWSLTDAGRQWKRNRPNDTPQRWMLQFGAFDPRGTGAAEIWTPLSIGIAGTFLVVCYLGSCFLWHLSLGLLFHDERFRPGWVGAAEFGIHLH